MNTYTLYKNDFIPCIFCKKVNNLYNAKSHLKTKKCQTLQQICKDKAIYEDLILEYYKHINELKSEIRFNQSV